MRKKDYSTQKIPLDKVFASALSWDYVGYGRLLEPAAAELALSGLPGRLSGK